MQGGSIFTPPPTEAKRSLPLVWLITIPLLLVAAGVFYWYLWSTPPAPKPAPGQSAYVPPEGLLRAGNPEFDRYLDFFRVENVKGTVVLNFAGNRSVMISGLFENRGEKYVDAAEIKLTFLDTEGKLIRERIAAPLRPETGLKNPMKGLERRSWSVRFDDLPVYMELGDLSVVLTGLRFAPKDNR